jgi:hypothetical protein
MQDLLREAVGAIIPESVPFSSVIVANAFFVLTLMLILFVLLVFGIGFVLDVIVDIWKLPLAVIVDALKYAALFNPWFGAAAILVGALLFIFVSDVGVKWVFAVISVAAAIAIIFLPLSLFTILLAIIPCNLVMMLFAIVFD